MPDTEEIAEMLYEFITGYRYHGPLVHDLVKPESAKKRLISLVEYCNIGIEDVRLLLCQAKDTPLPK